LVEFLLGVSIAQQDTWHRMSGLHIWYSFRRLGRSPIASKVISNHLARPFVPPPLPFGPPFVRESFRRIFNSCLQSSTLPIFYGPSGNGKSTALLNELAGKKGVIVISLRNATAKDVMGAVTNACGVAGLPDWFTFEATFKHAMQMYRKSAGPCAKSIILIEDIHAIKEDAKPDLFAFMGRLLQLQLEGFSSVVFSVSDYQAILWVMTASGYSSRLVPIIFPDLSEEELISQLSKASKEHKLNFVMATQLQTIHTQVPFTEEKLPTSNTYFIVLEDDKISKIVHTLGTHMGEVTSCLLSHLEGVALEDALETVIQRSLVKVEAALSTIQAAQKMLHTTRWQCRLWLATSSCVL
jgi:hypothetical protein